MLRFLSATPLGWRAWLALALVAALALPPANAVAQAADESAEAATVFLQAYRLPAEAEPSDYVHEYDVAWTNATESFEYAATAPVDARPAPAILQGFEASGRVVRLMSLYTHVENANAAKIWWNVVLFRTADGAAQALANPSLAETIRSVDQLTAIESSGLPTGMVAYRTERTDAAGQVERNDIVLWQRGRVVFALAANGSPNAVAAAMPLVIESAASSAPLLEALPDPPDSFGPPAAYLPSAAKQLELLQALRDRMLPPDTFPDFEGAEIDSTNNPELLHEAPVAEEPISDVAFFNDRLVHAEKRIVGMSREFTMRAEAAGANPEPPSFTAGYHLYADAAGASQAIKAPPEEIALRIYQEQVSVPEPPTLVEVSPPLSPGDESRALKSSFDADAEPVEITTIRWRRGAVELFVSVTVAAGEDPTELLREAVTKLDAAYAASPLPGY